MSLTYLKGSCTKAKNNLLLVLEQGQAILDDGAKGTQLSMVITTLATAAERCDAASEKLSLAIDKMDDDSARSSEELKLEGSLSLLGEAEQLLAKLKKLQPPAADAMVAQALAGTRNGVVLHQLLKKLTNHVISPTVIPPPRPSMSVKLPTLTIPTFNGKPLQWTPFGDSFLAAVDGNDRLAPVEKIAYLRGKLEGAGSSCWTSPNQRELPRGSRPSKETIWRQAANRRCPLPGPHGSSGIYNQLIPEVCL